MTKQKEVCDICGNVKVLYWCDECLHNSETDTCDTCGRSLTDAVDNAYHDNCNA